ncbi:MAG: HEPN domain-containing protein [Betaproteobacteria bacterium]|nr:HEPN domain-containing protein [Betaproteobacteria bacterium]
MSVEKNLATARVWSRQAERELTVARKLQALGEHAPACFHAQQAAEFILKSALVAHDREFPRTHLIDVLLEAFPSGFRAPLARLRDQALFLNKLYLPTRYPGALGEQVPADAYTAADGSAAIRAAGRILRAAEGIIKAAQRAPVARGTARRMRAPKH